jgi:hypothetical protein
MGANGSVAISVAHNPPHSRIRHAAQSIGHMRGEQNHILLRQAGIRFTERARRLNC